MSDFMCFLIAALQITACLALIFIVIWSNLKPKTTDDKVIAVMDKLYSYAKTYVHYAREFMKDSAGSEKMQYVVERLCNKVPKDFDSVISVVDLKGIAQTAYDEMKNSEAK